MVKWIFLIGCFFVLSSCDLLEGKDDRTPVARVNNNFLYEEDIAYLVDNIISSEDSAVVVSSYINEWATEELLVSQALINISEEQQQQYDKLVRQYKVSLLTEAYKNTMVSRDLDSVISQEEIDTLYNKDKTSFLLNDDLLKIRYVQLEEDNTNVSEIKKLLKNYESSDKIALLDMALQFKTVNLNDSVWIKKEVLFSRVPVFKNQDINLTSGRFAEIKDSTGIYVYKVEDRLNKGDIAPSAFIAPTLRQIILNRRKLELIRNIEKDITKDAIKNNNFEIYNKK
ncbi:hypothetical protein SCB49_11829 [unidentified eubacterium SCB49]|nr:hypothetical protein SCB49_11829 [unidentified eubacterium SCB49]